MIYGGFRKFYNDHSWWAIYFREHQSSFTSRDRITGEDNTAVLMMLRSSRCLLWLALLLAPLQCIHLSNSASCHSTSLAACCLTPFRLAPVAVALTFALMCLAGTAIWTGNRQTRAATIAKGADRLC